MVPLPGLEPVLNCFRQILSLLCLPFHPYPMYWRLGVYHDTAEAECIMLHKVSRRSAFFKHHRSSTLVSCPHYRRYGFTRDYAPFALHHQLSTLHTQYITNFSVCQYFFEENFWWAWRESNSHSAGYEPVALTVMLHAQVIALFP